MSSQNLHNARSNKYDEFYTQRKDVENELVHYAKHFKNKVIYCNCDNPAKSQFWKFFVDMFEPYGIKKVMATYYEPDGQSYLYEYSGESTTKTLLQGDGDFRTADCIEILKRADIVVTNPPFSLFRQYIMQLMEYDKKFIVMGNINAITYKDFFSLLKSDKVWIGFLFNKSLDFILPDSCELKGASYVDGNGCKFGRVRGISFYTNLEIDKHNTFLPSTNKMYYGNESEYSKYDNYNAINVDKVVDIPDDYYGVMGVPVTFLGKYCPEQFEILGTATGRNEFDELAHPTKKYENPIQHNKDGTTINGSKINTAPTILVKDIPTDKLYYTADNADGILIGLYRRILIRRKRSR